MCFDFMSSLFAEPSYLAIKKMEIEKKDPDPKSVGKYYCRIILNDNTEKNVTLTCIKIMTLWDAMSPEVKKAVVFPNFIYSGTKSRSTVSADKIFNDIQKGNCERKLETTDQFSKFFNDLIK